MIFDKYSDKNNTYTSRIKDSKYIEKGGITVPVTESYQDICECIISKNDLHYEISDGIHKREYIRKVKLRLASEAKSFFDSREYSKKFTHKLVEDGLVTENNMSSILFLNEYFKVHVILYNNDTQKYYKTSLKESYEPIYITYKNNEWQFHEMKIDTILSWGELNDLSGILTMDISSIFIYKTDMLSLSNYKLKDLEEKASGLDILLTDNGKKKRKQQLYDEIIIKSLNC